MLKLALCYFCTLVFNWLFCVLNAIVLNLRENRVKGISLIIFNLEVTLCLAFEVVRTLAVSLSALLTNWILKYKVSLTFATD